MWKLKTAGIVLAVVCAVAAFAAPMASASYNSEVETTTVSGSQTAEITLTTDVMALNCSVVTFAGTQKGVKKESGVYGSETVRVHPSFETCKPVILSPAVNTAGCDFVVAEATELKAPMSIVCEPGKAITIKDKAGLGCEIKFSPQSPSGNVGFTNAGGGKTRSVVWGFSVTGIAYSWTAGCPNAKGKGGSNTNGTLSGSASFKGTNAAFEQVGIWVTQSGTAPPASYDSEIETTTLSGSQGEEMKLTTDIGSVRCKAATFAGTQSGELTETGISTSSALTVHPTLATCNLSGQAVDVITTGCDYEVAKATELKASTTIVCEAGKVITIKDKAGLGCEVVVTPQSPAGQVSFTNAGSGSERNVTWKLELSGIAYSWTAGCPNAKKTAGSKTNGTYTGSELIKGLNGASEQVGIWVT